MAGLMCQINSILCQPADSWFGVSGTGWSGCWIHRCRRQSKSPQWSCMHTCTRIQDCSVVMLGNHHPGCHSRNIRFGRSLHQSWKRSREGVPKSRWRWLRASFSSCLGCWKSLAVRSWDFGATDFTVFRAGFLPMTNWYPANGSSRGAAASKGIFKCKIQVLASQPLPFQQNQSIYLCQKTRPKLNKQLKVRAF